jgi:Na+/glutamate symporter
MDLSPDEPARPATPADPLATMVPYKNPQALTSYYLGLFAIFPVLGLFLGIAALVLGTRGLKFQKEFPESKGKAHAGIGIGCGTVGLLINVLIIGGIIAAVLSRPISSP